MNELALFAGVGGGILGGKLLGWNTICAVERDAYAAAVLAQRQNDGLFEAFPIWSDVTTFDGKPWRGIVDVVSGGFPCQDISVAGKGEGISGKRSGLWAEMFRIISEVQPEWVFVENSPQLKTRGLEVILNDLAQGGYNAAWGVFSARDCGAPHKRERMWIVAHSNDKGLQGEEWGWKTREEGEPNGHTAKRSWWSSEPGLGRVVDGVAHRAHRLKAIGNGQVPLVAASAFLGLAGVLGYGQMSTYQNTQEIQ